MSGPGFQGELRAAMRPQPYRQPGFAELATAVQTGEFAGQRAIVVGGTRGLGEVTAKLLAAGGAAVTVIYHLGRAEAENIAAEINAAGGQCSIACFDATQPAPVSLAAPPTHLWGSIYAATSQISQRLGQFFRAALQRACDALAVERRQTFG